MAILATNRIYVSAGGVSGNGGRYDASLGGSKNYALQDLRQQSYTGLTTSGAGSTTITLPSGKFDPLIVGNCIRISSGTNFTAADYMVITRTNDLNVVLDRTPTPALAGAAGVGVLGGAKPSTWLTDTNIEALTAGNIVYLKAGATITLPSAVDISNAGTLSAPIIIEGYNSTPGDEPNGTDMPLLDVSTNSFFLGTYHIIKHIRITGLKTTSEVLGLRGGCRAKNCWVENTGTGSTPKAIAIKTADAQAVIIGCQVRCNGGYGIYGAGASNQAKVIDCDIQGAVVGVYIGRKSSVRRSNFYNCGTGVLHYTTSQPTTVLNCNFYKCNLAISPTTVAENHRAFIVNNIFQGCGKGIDFDSATPFKTDVIDYNAYYDNVQDIDGGLSYGVHDVQADPKLKDPLNGDFSLGYSSPCIAAGIRLNRQVGE